MINLYLFQFLAILEQENYNFKRQSGLPPNHISRLSNRETTQDDADIVYSPHSSIHCLFTTTQCFSHVSVTMGMRSEKATPLTPQREVFLHTSVRYCQLSGIRQDAVECRLYPPRLGR